MYIPKYSTYKLYERIHAYMYARNECMHECMYFKLICSSRWTVRESGGGPGTTVERKRKKPIKTNQYKKTKTIKNNINKYI